MASRTASLAGAVGAVFALAAFAAGCSADDREESSDVQAPAATRESPLEGTLPLLNGEPQDLSEFRGEVVLVVNTASECGFTPQFQGLQELYEEKRREGFVVLGFPADDVAEQEPRSNAEIADFCESNFGVEFPMFALVTAEGDDAIPLFRSLGEPDWNFNKYLLDRRGRLVRKWGATTKPDDPALRAAIDAELRS